MEFIRRPFNDVQEIIAQEKGQELGFLRFDYIPAVDSYRFLLIDVIRSQRGSRIALALGSEFISIVGPNKTIFGTITNRKTKKWLKQSGVINPNTVTRIDDPDQINRVPMLRLARRLGVQINSLTVKSHAEILDLFDPDEIIEQDYLDSFTVDFSATT